MSIVSILSAESSSPAPSVNAASNSATILSSSLCGMVRSIFAASTSALSSSCLKYFSSRLADGLPIATRIAAAFCGRVRLSAVVTTQSPEGRLMGCRDSI